MLDLEFKYYIDNQDKLVNEYRGRFIVIKNQEVVGAYSTEHEAYIKTKEKYELGTFLIQLVEQGEQSYSQTFHSRVTV